MDLFPYPYRGEQREIVRRVRETVADGLPLVMESGTGTGKTVSSLTGALEAALGTGKKVVYLTRTKSQQKQVITEVAKISGKHPLICIGLQGRSSTTCPMMKDDPELMSGTAEELSKLCSEFKKKDPGSPSSCEFFDNIEETDPGPFIDILKDAHPQPEAFFDLCMQKKLCPYEFAKYILPKADVVAAPYPFLFSPHVMDRFIQWMGVPLSGMVVIVDEAHNLPMYLREVMTSEYSARALELAEKEAAEWKDPEVYKGFKVTDITSVFRECMDNALSEYLDGDDGVLPYNYMQDELMDRLGVSSVSLDAIYKGLMEQGEIVTAHKKAKHKLPRSYMGSFGSFLAAWSLCDENTYVSLIVGGDNPKFEAFCLDPYEAAMPLRECWSSISMSGTLEPLKDYSYELGMDDAVEVVFPTPFPKENLKVLYVDDVSTNFEELRSKPETYDNIVGHVVRLVNCTRRNTAVFFPSYALMDRFIHDGIPDLFGRDVYYERRGMPQSELMDIVSDFRAADGSVLFCVTGGRISEGLDFPDKELELAILIGIPFPKPTAKQEALRRYCEYRFGSGWEHAIKVPTQRKMRQAVGRLIRSETDRGVAVILDRRISTMEGLGAVLTDDLVREVKAFFGE
jgi:DNA excision repair protein ERCC-2